VPRPAKSLLELVDSDSFRPARHFQLLETDPSLFSEIERLRAVGDSGERYVWLRSMAYWQCQLALGDVGRLSVMRFLRAYRSQERVRGGDETLDEAVAELVRRRPDNGLVELREAVV
jgi:hypothetical protein